MFQTKIRAPSLRTFSVISSCSNQPLLPTWDRFRVRGACVLEQEGFKVFSVCFNWQLSGLYSVKNSLSVR